MPAARLLSSNLRASTSRARFNSNGNRWHLNRNYSTPSNSRHAQLYTETLPAMMPIFLLGSAIYLGLRLTQMNLSHERYMEQAEARIKALEDDITTLEAARRVAEATPPSDSTPKDQQQSPSRWRLF